MNADQQAFAFDELPVIKGFPELRWTGKRPYRSTLFYPAQLKECYGEPVDNWMNKLYWGDNLQVMSHLLREYRGGINLIYIDPPFDSKANYKKKIRLRNKDVTNDAMAFEEKQYSDIWSNDEYLQFMFERIILCRELLADDGVFVIHCDWHKATYLRCICDEVFGSDHFVNEIIWHYYNKMQGNVKHFAANHDNIFVYRKGGTFTFNRQTEEREQVTRQIKRVWDSTTQRLVNAKGPDGKVIYIESTEKALDDVWWLSMLQPADKKEPLGYPTQKPETLVSLIVAAFSNPGDIVFDCFMGSGTTQAVAMKTGRRFLGADINLGSIQITVKRLLLAAKEAASILNGATHYTGFELYNVNNYDFFRNPVEARDLLIQALDIQPFSQGHVYDGELDGRMVKLLPTNRIASKGDIADLVANLPYAQFDARKEEASNEPVERITLVCMGHEPDLKAALEQELSEYVVDIEVMDVLKDRSDLQLKREAEADVAIKDGKLVIRGFWPMNLLQKLSMEKESVEDWREMVESVLVDWNYDGAVMEPTVIDIPEDKNGLVSGVYEVPDDAGTIRVKITDVLSESLEVEVRA